MDTKWIFVFLAHFSFQCLGTALFVDVNVKRANCSISMSERDTCIGKLIDGQREGMWRCTDNDFVNKVLYHKGMLNGVWKTYDKQERLISERTYVRDTLHGVWVRYYTDQKVYSISLYDRGELTYVSKYHPNGYLEVHGGYEWCKVKRKEIFIEGDDFVEVEKEVSRWESVKNGKWVYYSEEGEKIKLETYLEGSLMSTEYFDE